MDRKTTALTRRGFLATAATLAAAGYALGGTELPLGVDSTGAASDAVKIPLRRMGRTNLQVGVIAGNETMSDPALIEAALEAGVNYWHKGGPYLMPVVKKTGRDKLYIEVCVDPTGSAEKDMSIFTDHLRGGLEYADFYKMHGGFTQQSVEAFGKLKDKGLVKYLAASFHSCKLAMEALKTGVLDQIQISGSPISGAPLAELLMAARDADVGTMLMKTMLGGEKGWNNESLLKEIAPYTGRGLSVPEGIVAACLAMEGLTAMVVTTSSMERFASLVRAARETGAQQTASAGVTGAVRAAFCAVCGACSEACPAGVAVGEIMRAEMYAAGYGEPERGRRLYRSLDASRNASMCTGCGTCERACRFGVASPGRIAAAARMLA